MFFFFLGTLISLLNVAIILQCFAKVTLILNILAICIVVYYSNNCTVKTKKYVERMSFKTQLIVFS